MRRTPWITYLWPGLPHCWVAGSWTGLAVACAATALVCGLLASSLVWVELVGQNVLRCGIAAAAGLWIGAATWALRHPPASATPPAATQDLFRTSLGEYLQGNWFEAEALVGKILAMDARDAEARLLLATLLRHTGRLAEADEQLDRLELLDGALPWREEIAAERDLLSTERGLLSSERQAPEQPKMAA